MNTFDRICGNELQKQLLTAGGFGHAYIIEGAAGSGKRTFALLAAASLACSAGAPPCGTCRSCASIFEGRCPDIYRIDTPSDRRSISVDAVRAIRQTAYIRPNDLDFKMYIINDASVMTAQAQNALLKILEEPPPSVYFLLLCTNTAGLLPTVRSRAPSLTMQRFTDEELTGHLISRSPSAAALQKSDPTAFASAVTAARGSYGAALGLLGKTGINREAELHKSVTAFIDAIAGGDISELTEAAAKLPSKREELSDRLGYIALALRDLYAVKKAPGTPLLFYNVTGRAASTAGAFTAVSLLKMSEFTLQRRDELASNVNVFSAQVNYAAGLWRLK